MQAAGALGVEQQPIVARRAADDSRNRHVALVAGGTIDWPLSSVLRFTCVNAVILSRNVSVEPLPEAMCRL